MCKCCNCGKNNTEYAKFKLFWVFSYTVCQSCISKAFRNFVKDK